jgi:hypothetical protein
VSKWCQNGVKVVSKWCQILGGFLVVFLVGFLGWFFGGFLGWFFGVENF